MPELAEHRGEDHFFVAMESIGSVLALRLDPVLDHDLVGRLDRLLYMCNICDFVYVARSRCTPLNYTVMHRSNRKAYHPDVGLW